ncbi:MAG: carboxypeptidase regulatory-like domain-containing protein [Pyrinomonadaceae bacterium]|nr:carboxypeptidase regulatory-like domain-containing protein [Pyrinomonadaceae bacterium]
MKTKLLSILTVLSFFLLCTSIFGQVTTGSIRGVVTDPTGAVVPGTTVRARNEGTGVLSPSVVTNQEGIFVITNLIPGLYSVIVTPSSGFKSKTISNIEVKLGLDTEVRVELEIGQPQEVVTVTLTNEEIVQTTSEISSSISSRKVLDLPSNAAGGGIDTLALTVPGVTPGFGNVNSNGITLSVNGNRARSNNFTINGTDNNDLTIGGPSFFVGNNEIVQEFQIITNNFSAQYGRNQGAIVNIVTKAGTNQLTGAAFIYHRNSSALDAMTNIERRDPNRSKRDKFISNVFGGVLGGPIIKNKLFYFGSYQGIRQSENTTLRAGNLAILPTEFSRLRAAFPGNAVVQALTTQSAFALSNGRTRQRSDRPVDRVCISTNPSADCPASGVGPGWYAAAFPEIEFSTPYDQNEFTIRGDWNITDKDNLTAFYFWQKGVSKNGLASSNGFTGDIPFKSQNLSGFYTRQISSKITNYFQATFQRLFVKFGGGCEDTLKGCIPDPSKIGEAFTNIQFAGLRGQATNVTVQTIGIATNLPQGRTVDVYQFNNKVTWLIGRHTLTFGGDIRYLKNAVPFLPNYNGVFRYNSVAAVTSNTPSSITLADGQPTIEYTQLDRFLFFQDDWKVLPNLTLNLGIRYEYSGQPINLLNEITTARESSASTAFFRTSLPLEARVVPRLPSDKNNWAPRLGFAWSPDFGEGPITKFIFGGKDGSVIRGGFSIAYDPVFYNIMLNISTSAPTVFLDTITGASVFALPSTPIGSQVRQVGSGRLRRNTFDPRLLTQTTVSSDFHSPYSMQYSIGFQRQINNNNVFEIRYVGNRGKSLFQSINRNPRYDRLWNGFSFGGFNFPSFQSLMQSFGAPAPQNCVDDPSTPDNEAACAGRLLAGRGLIRERTNTGESQYDGLQIRYNGRFLDRNLILGASYTLSKTLDNASEIFSFGESAFAQNPFDVKAGEKSFSGFDRRHALSVDFIYDVPFYREQKGFLGKLLGGFQINGIYTLASGRPYTPSEFLNAFGLGLNSYLDAPFAQTFLGFDNFRPFLGNPRAPITAVGISQIDAFLLGYISSVTNPNGFISLTQLNKNGSIVPVTPNDVRFIFNGPGAARIFGTPFGNTPRNGFRGPTLNNLNLGIFKTTNVNERLKVQFRFEAFNFLNHPNASYGVSAGSTLPGSTFLEDAGISFGDKGEAELSSRRIQFGLRIIF